MSKCENNEEHHESNYCKECNTCHECLEEGNDELVQTLHKLEEAKILLRKCELKIDPENDIDYELLSCISQFL
jgi:hypothetical protein